MSVPSVISLDLRHLSDSLSKIDLALRSRSSEAPLNESKPFGTTLGQARSSLLTAIAYTRTLGGIPNFYGDPQSGGRVGPLGFHLIQMPSDLRHMMLDGSGLIDLDLEGCFPSIFLSLGRHLGFATGLTEAYLHNKTDCHEQWRDVSGHHTARDFKGLILSFFTDGRLSGWHETASGAVFGEEVMEALRQDRGLRALYNEIHNGMSTVLQHQERHTSRGEHILVNAIGCELTVASPGTAFGAQCSHVLTGLEQFAIQSICDRMVGLKAVIYDGIVATPQDCAGLEAIIRSESERLLGFPLALRLKATTFVSPMQSWPAGVASLKLMDSPIPLPHGPVTAVDNDDLFGSAAA